MYELRKRPLRVALSGKSGCGNTTVSSLLAKTLGVALVNYTFRQLSKETGLSLEEIIEQARADDSFDIRVDRRQVALAMKDSCVLGSRLAIWMLKEADFKVYLYAGSEVRAARIHWREGGSREAHQRFTELRDNEDTRRYKKIYHIDNDDYQFADLIIDTAKYNPEEIVSLITAELRNRGLIAETK
ncbi:MAG: cytidylate kinase family protein [Treponema sp.]|jgi:cytidylate kinase|nr:cytidylate kinase family protein [Treponema sp.]